jgi:hypothetical protein
MASISPTPEITTIPQAPAVSDPVAKKPAAKRVSVPPPGYKFVKVHRNGEIVTVKRKLTPEELAAAEDAAKANAASPVASPVSSPNPNSPAQIATPTSPIAKTPVSGPTAQSPTADTPKTVAVTTKAVDSESTDQFPDSPLSPEAQAALDEQKTRNRMSRTKKFRHSMVSGLAHLVAVAVPTVEIGQIHDGDEVVDHVDDPSEDDLDDDDDDEPGFNEKSKEVENGHQDEKGGISEITRAPEHQCKLICVLVDFNTYIVHFQLTI